jgi:hypothetical protein
MKTIGRILIGIFLLANFNSVRAETRLDFDGDGRTDFGIARIAVADGGPYWDWWINRSSDSGLILNRFGLAPDLSVPTFPPGDTLTPADFDGDRKTDLAVWRPSYVDGMSAFYILNSSDSTLRIENFGKFGDFVSAVGDFDGDGRADPAAYRYSYAVKKLNSFIYRGSRNNPSGALTTVLMGIGTGVVHYPGDFDGDGKQDFCLYNTVNGGFTLRRSSDGGSETINLGTANDYPRAGGDFDGDGRSDFCVIKVADHGQFKWYIRERDGGGTGINPIVWGRHYSSQPWDQWLGGGDYDGDGRSDIGVVSQSGSQLIFRIRRASNGALLEFPWGLSGDFILGKM